jgi:hypothetical protein
MMQQFDIKHLFRASGIMTTLVYRHDSETIILGTRLGHVDIFRVTEEAGKYSSRNSPLLSQFILYDIVFKTQSLISLHSKEGVTDLLFHHDAIYSAGKDGRYCQLGRIDSSELFIKSRCRISHSMDWIQTLKSHNENLMTLGFYKKNFIVFDATRNFEVKKDSKRHYKPSSYGSLIRY